jgi:hypothetical protein
MDDEEQLCEEPPYMLPRGQAARLLGVTASDLDHLLWLKGVPTVRIGDHEYIMRRALFDAVDGLFEESMELAERLAGADPHDFVLAYDGKFPCDAWGEKAIRKRVMDAVFDQDYRDAVWRMNFCGSVGLSDGETARISDALEALGHLTSTGEIYRRLLKRRMGDAPEEAG